MSYQVLTDNISLYIKALLLSIPFLIGIYFFSKKAMSYFIPMSLAMGFALHILYQYLFYILFKGDFYGGMPWLYTLFISDFINIGAFLLSILVKVKRRR